jgi:methionine aminopeptidase
MSKSEVGYRHDIIVHAMERYIDLLGHHSVAQVQSGENSRKFWSMFSKPWLPERGTRWLRSMREGDLIRAEMRASKDGYWSDAARMLTVGEAAKGQLQAYRDLVELKEVAVAELKPGNKANSVFDSVVAKARDKDIELVAELGVGHGIGVTTYEPPYLVKNDDTNLEPGMVIALDPVIYGHDREILRSKDTILITDKGCRILGRYIDWDRPHVPTHLSPRSTVEFARQ